MPRGADPEREKEYDKLVDEFHDQHRYAGREEEVASRIINKQRSQFGETKAAQDDDKHGASPDRNLPIENYDQQDIKRIIGKLDHLSKTEIRKVKTYEATHHDRKTLIEELDRRLE